MITFSELFCTQNMTHPQAKNERGGKTVTHKITHLF